MVAPRILDEKRLARLLRQQSGVVSRAQVLELGGDARDIRRRIRRREWARVHPGVYVDHTGPLSREQRRWAAVLAHAPATLHRWSALEAHGFTRDRRAGSQREPVQLAIDVTRSVTPVPGVAVERVADLARWTMPNRRPARVTVEYALLKVASSKAANDEAGAIGLLADGCRQGCTTAARLVDTLHQLPRLPGRARLLEILDDVASGAHSVLEQRDLVRIERAHGLAAGTRQVRELAGEGTLFRDVRYREQHTLVELDGRFGHSDAEDRWDDLDRDLTAAVRGELTVRLGWRQVLEPCRVTLALGAILRARGWRGTPVACGPDCPAADAEGSGSARGRDPSRSSRAATPDPADR